jgi:hypothetical protein
MNYAFMEDKGTGNAKYLVIKFLCNKNAQNEKPKMRIDVAYFHLHLYPNNFDFPIF